MYQQIKTWDYVYLENGIKVKPIATLKDEYDRHAHIWINDNCYVLGLERHREGSVKPQNYVVLATHIFPEAFKVLRDLPEL